MEAVRLETHGRPVGPIVVEDGGRSARVDQLRGGPDPRRALERALQQLAERLEWAKHPPTVDVIEEIARAVDRVEALARAVDRMV